MQDTPARRTFLKAGAAAAALLLTGCTGEPASPGSATPAPTPSLPADLTFTMGTAADPVSLDPALVVDSESLRVTRQVMETLVGVDRETGVPAPGLAVEFEEQDNGRAYVFKLREGVTFHDGTPFDAEAVRANFERWFRLPEAIRPADGMLPYRAVFGAFADEDGESLYRGCDVLGPLEIKLELNRRYSGLVAALAMPAFAIASPAALEAKTANELDQERNGVRISVFGLHPVGTGPYQLKELSDGQVVLEAFDQYWGPAAQVGTVMFTTLAHPAARLRELQSGDIDGYDLVTPETYAGLVRGGMQILQRDPYAVSYLGINREFGPLSDVRIRQAIAHAVDRDLLLKSFFLEGSVEAKQFVPPSLGVNNEDIPYYEYDPDRARELLADAGYDGGALPFYYPLNVTRAYLPAPEKIYAELSRQLTAAGFNIQPKPVDWNDGYLQKVRDNQDRALHLGGLNGSYRDPDNFLGTLFGRSTGEFGLDNAQLTSRIARARTLEPGPERTTAYLQINEQLARLLPAVPLAFPVSAVAMGPRVESYPVSPMLDERFNLIRLRTEA
ncbi:extracellular solute-binding protein [Arthrobacter crystallopoietes BAB-32]|uniref:Extracellular solute-binding protein n=1 Tax=Arthrobacter crystallopoietes BAB-32 TaxID=1246476 RepID=N1V0X5_9MICC|nr:ABC transporter substrate-binding protein [Arthrobacter crystallopoietes]EMY34980.1 extracellular solute-binding protein [Arthrobacter crystallopoietes BAB-32]